MDTAFIKRTLRASLVLCALGYLLFSYYRGGAWAVGFTGGACWSVTNLYLLQQLVVRFITPEDRPWAPLLGLALVKFPLLYVAGYLLLSQTYYPVTAPLLGFSLPFAVLVLKAGGRALLGIHGPGAGRTPKSVFGRP